MCFAAPRGAMREKDTGPPAKRMLDERATEVLIDGMLCGVTVIHVVKCKAQ